MKPNKGRQQQAKILRLARSLHRTTGALLFVLFIVVSLSGLLLGWKKHSGGILLAKSHKGTSADLKDWLPLDSLYRRACVEIQTAVSGMRSLDVDRIDVRKDKGMVKFVFIEGFWGVQLDGATGNLLHIERRRADFIEKIHDGSILDLYFNTSDQYFKLVYTTLLGLALLMFSVTGFWLWYGPKLMRRSQKRLG